MYDDMIEKALEQAKELENKQRNASIAVFICFLVAFASPVLALLMFIGCLLSFNRNQ